MRNGIADADDGTECFRIRGNGELALLDTLRQGIVRGLKRAVGVLAPRKAAHNIPFRLEQLVAEHPVVALQGVELLR